MRLMNAAKPILSFNLAVILSAGFVLSACSFDQVTLPSWTGSPAPVAAPTPAAQPTVAHGPVVSFVLSAQSGTRRFIVDPEFGGNVTVTKGDEYFAASGRQCIRFTTEQMSLMNNTKKNLNGRHVLCRAKGGLVLHHPLQ